MKKLFLGTIAILALGTFAHAADIAPGAYKAPMIASAYNWTGFYIGGGGGYGLFNAEEHLETVANVPFTRDSREGGRGYFGTVSGGFDYDFRNSWVAGFFADAQFGSIDGSLSDPSLSAEGRLTNRTNYAAGGRIGYLIAPNVLSYVNGGYSHAEFSGSTLTGLFLTANGVPAATTQKFERGGYFLGGGVENSLGIFSSLFGPGWFMKSEYRLAEYDRVSILETRTPVSGGQTYNNVLKPYVQTYTTQLVYRFNYGR